MTKIITPQPGIMDIELYQGGAAHIDGVSNVVKLSSNENPFGPSLRPQRRRFARRGLICIGIRRRDHIALRAGHWRGAWRWTRAVIICGVGSDEILVTFSVSAYAGAGG